MAKGTTKKSRSKDRIDRRMGVQEALEVGIAAVEQDNRKQAHSIFQQTAEFHPNVSEIWVWLGGTSPNLEDAESAFEKAYTIDPENEQASLGLRWVRLRRKTSLADIMDATVPMPLAPEKNSVAEDTLHIEAVSQQALSAPTIAAVACPNCGEANAANEKFCAKCGQDLTATMAQDVKVPHVPAESKQGLPARTVVFVIVAIIAIMIALAALYLLAHPF